MKVWAWVWRWAFWLLAIPLLLIDLAIVGLSAGHQVRDLVVLATCLLGVVALVRRANWPWKPCAFAGVALAWVVLSAIGPDAPARPAHQPRPLAAQPPDGPRVGLALSGGGYRAALVHAGVLAALDTLDVPVTNLSTVSGGSIIGSFYAKGGDPKDFLRLLVEHRFNVRRDLLLLQNLVPVLVPRAVAGVFGSPGFDRIDVQAQLLDRLLLGGDLQSLAATSPQLMLCTTDLSTGALVGLLPRGLLIRGLPSPVAGLAEEFLPWPAMKRPLGLATAAAISGAFPGPFPARKLRLPEDKPTIELQLSDGGIADNSGLALMMSANGFHVRKAGGETGTGVTRLPLDMTFSARPRWDDPHWQVDLILASDGSMPMERVDAGSTLAAVKRATDVIAAMAGTMDSETLVRLTPNEYFAPLSAKDRRLHDDHDGRGFATQIDLGRVSPAAIDALASVASPYRRASIAAGAAALKKITTEHPGAPLPSWRVLTNEARETSWLSPLTNGATSLTSEENDALKRLLGFLHAELGDGLRVFRVTSTLDDQLEAADAEALFRLGQYFVLLRSGLLPTRNDDAQTWAAKKAAVVTANARAAHERAQRLHRPYLAAEPPAGPTVDWATVVLPQPGGWLGRLLPISWVQKLAAAPRPQ